MIDRRQVTKLLVSAVAKSVDSQDSWRWFDSYAEGLFSSAEKTHRSGTTNWDTHDQFLQT